MFCFQGHFTIFLSEMAGDELQAPIRHVSVGQGGATYSFCMSTFILQENPLFNNKIRPVLDWLDNLLYVMIQ